MEQDEAEGGDEAKRGAAPAAGGGAAGGEPEGGEEEARPAGGGRGGGLAEADFDEADFADEEANPVTLLARATQFVSRQLARLMAAAERRGGQLDKRQIDALAALARMMERWEALAEERAKEEELQSDEDLAEALRIINDKIIELARAEAERLVATGYRPAGGRADPE